MKNKQTYDTAVAMHQEQVEHYATLGLPPGNECVRPIIQKHMSRRALPENIFVSFLRELYELEAAGTINSLDVLFWKYVCIQELHGR